MSERVEERIGRILVESGKTMSAAESCTGGQISHLITTVSGSSRYYLGSVTSYAMSVKEKVLKVDNQAIELNGVVSSEVAAQMANGVRKLTGSDYAVSTTGLAGPGGDERNPEGTVWIGVCSKDRTVTICKHLTGSRTQNIRNFAKIALRELEKFIKLNK